MQDLIYGKMKMLLFSRCEEHGITGYIYFLVNLIEIISSTTVSLWELLELIHLFRVSHFLSHTTYLFKTTQSLILSILFMEGKTPNTTISHPKVLYIQLIFISKNRSLQM